MPDIEWMADLLRRVPVHCVDVQRAQAAGDVEAVRYSQAIAAWLDEARIAVAEVSAPPCRHEGDRRVGSDRLGGLVPVGDLPSELVVRDFPPGLAI